MRRFLAIFCVLAAAAVGVPSPAQAQDTSTATTVNPGDLFPEAPPAEEKPVPTRADVRARVIAVDNLSRDVSRIEKDVVDARAAKTVAEQNLASAQAARDNRVDVVLADERSRLDELKVDKDRRVDALADSRERLGRMTLDLYMLGPNASISLASDDPLGNYRVNQTLRVGVGNLRAEVAEKQRLVDTADDDIATQEARVAEAQLAVDAANADINRFTDDVNAADSVITRGEAELVTKRADGLTAQSTLVGMLREIGSPANSGKDPLVPVMGAPVLTAGQLTAWFADTRGPLQVGANNVAELAQLYIEEGQALGVRGDIAFIQAVVETGNFQYTGTNNFAGIGHCDSCPRGYPFPTAREGVRAQIQLLRSYADKNLKTADLPGGAMPGINPDRLGVRGCCASWWGLSGVWASALHYGGTILSIYDGALTHAQRNAAPPPPQ